MKQGVKSSEFYVLIGVLLYWVLQTFGIDIGDPGALGTSVEEVREAIHKAADGASSSEAGYYLAAIYIIGRKVLKFFDMKQPKAIE